MKKEKTCPRCGGPVKTGRLVNYRDFHWMPDQEEGRGFWESILHPAGALQIPEPSAVDGWSYPYGEIPTCHCPDCQLFFFEGREEP